MTPDSVAQIIRDALMAAFWLSAPVLLVAFAAGILVSLAQIVTSIQDSAFNTVPRLAATLATIVLAMPWMLKKALTYSVAIFGNLNHYGR